MCSKCERYNEVRPGYCKLSVYFYDDLMYTKMIKSAYFC